MNPVVLDSSYALACIMPDEQRPKTMEAMLNEALLAPFIWPIEIASALRNGLRQRRIDQTQATVLAGHVAGFDAKIAEPWHHDASRYLELALVHGLTPYDAIYLDLCLSQRSELATCDLQLAQAAARVGIRVHA